MDEVTSKTENFMSPNTINDIEIDASFNVDFKKHHNLYLKITSLKVTGNLNHRPFVIFVILTLVTLN